jgi:hypothetical protein
MEIVKVKVDAMFNIVEAYDVTVARLPRRGKCHLAKFASET